MPGDTCDRSRGAGIMVHILLALMELRLQQRERCRTNICTFFSLVPEKQECIPFTNVETEAQRTELSCLI